MMNQLRTFMDNVSFSDSKWRKQYRIGMVLAGIIIGIMITNWAVPEQIGFFITSYLLGVPCVIALADRENLYGNILGILSNVCEIIIYAKFEVWGMVYAGIYFGFMHIVGLFRGKNKKNLDTDGKIKITSSSRLEFLLTVGFIIVGLIMLLFFGKFFGFTKSPGLLGGLFYYGNIATFIISVCSQYFMIMGKNEGWWGWFTSNFINFFLSLVSGNIWFMFRDVLYQINSVLSIYSWTSIKKHGIKKH